jgi:hypothetical protein
MPYICEYIDTDEDIPPNKKRCICGQVILFQGLLEHERTPLHQARVRELDSKGQLADVDTSMEVERPEPISSYERRKIRVTCECGTEVSSYGLKQHLTTKIHADKIERKDQGLPEPVGHTERDKQKITCACGTTHTVGGTIQHAKSAKHLKWLEENPT